MPAPAARVNPYATREAWTRARDAAARDPGAFHGDIAKRALHWFDASLGAHGGWITWSDAHGTWTGWDARTGAALTGVPYDVAHEPWRQAFDDADAPVFRWFAGGRTNACFNEVDRHVLAGHGAEPAFLVEGDRWDQSLDGGRGGPAVAHAISRRELLVETAICALVLRALGLERGDRIALNMPNVPAQIFYTEAAKRLGIVYTPVFGGFSDKTLSDRLHDAGARVVITADGGYRNAQVVPFKEAYTDPALDNYVAVGTALDAVRERLATLELPADARAAIGDAAADAVAGEITVERSDVMRGVGGALATLTGDGTLDAAAAARVRTALAAALVTLPARAEAVVVVRHAGVDDLNWRGERDRWHHELAAAAERELLEAARAAGLDVTDRAALLALPDTDLVRAVWAAVPPEPLDAEYPLFIIYTSGSTGKPKGVVHVHGGYTAGIAHTMQAAFDARPGDVLYVVADPGWITGQSYMISAALLTRVTSVLAEGAPTFPSAGRFTSIIERYGVTIFKAGVTFLKTVMTDPQHAEDMRQYRRDSLRVATFCAEPCSPSVQAFAMREVTPWYINSYWATEHGGIVWTHLFGNGELPLRADAHTWPLPWVFGDVWTEARDSASGTRDSAGGARHRRADDGEKGEIVITAPYPYLARTVWGDADGFRVEDGAVAPGWRGDLARWRDTYWARWSDARAYTQGDFAVRHADGSFSLHGRSDDVINVSGHRIGTEEIEGAILRDKQVNADSAVGNVIVVGAPHREKGLTPIAFVTPAPGRTLTAEDRRRLTELVRQEKGAVAVPSDFLEVPAFPETRSGKYMRRMVRAIVEGAPLGDTSTLRNPEALEPIERAVARWQQRQRLSETQTLLERWRYYRVEYHPAAPGVRVATVYVSNPPVNALNERALDELAVLVEHLARRTDVAAVIFTGAGAGSFVAGADVKQLLEEMHSLEHALPLPNTAHLAFRRIEQMGKPCIAAINGVALGGGLEFALACHYRIAEPTARFGQPEIRLRLLPGYGGTQRLPRLLAWRAGAEGARRAVEMILGGHAIEPDEARGLGLVDDVVEGSVDAVSRAAALAARWARGRDGALAAVMRDRPAMLAAWERPLASAGGEAIPLDGVLDDPEVQRLRRAGQAVGRGPALDRAVEAIGTGWTDGLAAGLQREARLFGEAVVDPQGGKQGIRDFLEKRAAPLPPRRARLTTDAERTELAARGELLPVGAPFFPGFTPVPDWQHAMGVTRDPETGRALHGEPATAEREVVIPVERPGPNDALVYVLASEVNFNDIWAITGVPVSQFEAHDRDWHVTGSGGVGLVVALGSEAKREGRLTIGQLVTIYSGQSELLSPLAGLDPMFADFRIQGYETGDGSHAQFAVCQAVQCFPVPNDLTLEAAGSYVLNLGTIVRALFTALRVQPGRTIFIEGAATGTGHEAVKSAARAGLDVVGLVSSAARAEVVRAAGARGAIDRKDPAHRDLYGRVPDGTPEEIAGWVRAGEPLLARFREATGGRLADYAVSHAGEASFPRTFQLLGDGGTLTFYGASSGYHFTFVGKPGRVPVDEMLRRAELRAGQGVLVYYGPGARGDELVDAAALEAIEAARAMGARIAVAATTDAQREFVQSLGFGDAVRGVVSLEELKRREGDDFDWPRTMPSLPDAKRETEAFKLAVRDFQDRTMKPFGAAVGRLLRTPDNPRGYPDLIVERAGHDALAASTSLVKPYTGRVVYAEDVGGRRFSFYAPQVWMRQRRILMPTAAIVGTHLNNAYEVLRMHEMLGDGQLGVTEPTMVPWDALPEAHQAMWDNRHAGATYVCNHALPRPGLRSKEELYEAWSAMLAGDEAGGDGAAPDATETARGAGEAR